MRNFITVSVVSHLHASDVLRLLGELHALNAPNLANAVGGPAEAGESSPSNWVIEQVVVTVNVPEPRLAALAARISSGIEEFSFAVRWIDNAARRGFGTNHNAAFALVQNAAFASVHNAAFASVQGSAGGDLQGGRRLFCVLNPDIAFGAEPFSKLVAAFDDARVGAAYPVQVDGAGNALDFERGLLTPGSLVLRCLKRVFGSQVVPSGPVAWASGAFLVFRWEAFAGLKGFDEAFYMYVEDVDVCLRLQLAGWRLCKVDAVVTHHTARRTLKSAQHLAWHVRGLMRLWGSGVYQEFLRRGDSMGGAV